MTLTLLDWAVIAGYLLLMLALGIHFRRRSSRNTEEYFVSGRQVAWWLAGTSMVATTFAADTPLVVTGLVYTQGIAGNWLWWSFLPSGMMTVFLFARLWRRSGLLTDVQFAEMRYSGKPAAFLRGFRAVYLGLLMNCLILGWVTKAMTSIVGSALGTSETLSLAICIFFLIPFTGFYVSLGGLWGVLWTDLFQFVLKMGIVIAVAYYGVRGAGGMAACWGNLPQCEPPPVQKRRASRPCSRIFRAASRARLCGRCRCSRSSCIWECSGGRFGIRERNRAAVDISRSGFSARAMNATACFPCSGSTSRTTRCAPGRGF